MPNDGVHDTTQAVTISVTDTNDVAPTITSAATASEAENTAAATVVYTATATDPDTVGTVAFSISGDDASLFSINSATGEVTFNTSPNFEAPADLNGDNAYQIIVHANDGVHDTTQAVTISVTDTNDVAPTITSAATASEGREHRGRHRGLHRGPRPIPTPSAPSRSPSAATTPACSRSTAPQVR